MAFGSEPVLWLVKPGGRHDAVSTVNSVVSISLLQQPLTPIFQTQPNVRYRKSKTEPFELALPATLSACT